MIVYQCFFSEIPIVISFALVCHMLVAKGELKMVRVSLEHLGCSI